MALLLRVQAIQAAIRRATLHPATLNRRRNNPANLMVRRSNPASPTAPRNSRGSLMAYRNSRGTVPLLGSPDTFRLQVGNTVKRSTGSRRAECPQGSQAAINRREGINHHQVLRLGAIHRREGMVLLLQGLVLPPAMGQWLQALVLKRHTELIQCPECHFPTSRRWWQGYCRFSSDLSG